MARIRDEPHCVADLNHHYNELVDSHCSHLEELQQHNTKKNIECWIVRARYALRQLIFWKGYLRGQSVLGADDGLQPPE